MPTLLVGNIDLFKSHAFSGKYFLIDSKFKLSVLKFLEVNP